jgi:di/tricarboxylate transporter
VLVVILTKCISVEEVYDFIDWRVIVLIGGMTSVGIALQKSSTADMLAEFVAGITAPHGDYVVLGAFILLTMLLTQLLSNAAAALVVLPIAMATGTQVGIDPRTLAVIVTLAASLSFIAPFEPACLLVYSPGRYRIRDFVISGVPLSLMAFVVLMVLVPVWWPLH